MKITVEEYFEKADSKWLPILKTLRSICQETEMEETVKWGIPVYTFEKKNVVGIGAFKSYAGLWFFNGVFLEDKYAVLVNAQEGKTRGQRHWRFQEGEIVPSEKVRAYVLEAIENQKQGKEIKVAKKESAAIPPAFKARMAKHSELKKQFEKLTQGRQKEYLAYFSEPKMEKTVISRVEKCIPLILEGAGLHDKYRK
jgi:uncharacterized protein YdeI (YjbR/CyaY-like superfamily)